jgi:hypothetical protein
MKTEKNVYHDAFWDNDRLHEKFNLAFGKCRKGLPVGGDCKSSNCPHFQEKEIQELFEPIENPIRRKGSEKIEKHNRIPVK